MKSCQLRIEGEDWSSVDWGKFKEADPNLIFAFGHPKYFEQGTIKNIKSNFSGAHVIGCSTAGEIDEDGVFDDSVVLTGIHFDDPKYQFCSAQIGDVAESSKAGEDIGNQLKADNLTSVFILGRGVDINGSEVIEGLKKVVGEKVLVSGGLAGDAGAFKQTYTVLEDTVSSDSVIAMGIYENSVKVNFGSYGGWEPFGPVRVVTKAEANVLYELDGEPALEIYKNYLGDHAKDLPASGLLFPFAILDDNEAETGLIRTILGIDEEAGSLTLAGDIPLNGSVRLMHAKNDNLVSGAKKAAEQAGDDDGVAILISCVGRKLVMGDDIDDEVDAVKDTLSTQHVTGFYSYGEIAPHGVVTDCRLHNQTMTITTFSQ